MLVVLGLPAMQMIQSYTMIQDQINFLRAIHVPLAAVGLETVYGTTAIHPFIRRLNNTMRKSTKNVCIFILIIALGFTSICGFISSIMIYDGLVEGSYPILFIVIVGLPSIFYLRRLTNLSFLYWIIMLPANGAIAGLIWAALPTYNDGLRILSVTISFVLIAFLTNRKRSSFLKEGH